MLSRSPILHTQRLTLSTLRPECADQAMDILFHERTGKTYMLPEYSSREATRVTFEHLMRLSLREDRFLYGIYLCDLLIGWIHETEVSGDRMEIGYAIHPDHQNQGYATEALRCVIQELFRMGFRHVRAGCFQENPASARVMVKCGMTPTGESEVIAYRGSSHVCVFYEISFVP